MDSNFCDGCLHQSVCVYQECTNRIVSNINIDLKHFPVNLSVDFKCRHRTERPVLRNDSLKEKLHGNTV